MSKIDLSIIIVSFNTKDLTLNCINSVISNTQGISYEIILVDNNSKDGSVKEVKKIKSNIKIRIIENKNNLGFAKGNNAGIKVSDGRYVLLLNSDTVVNSNVLGRMVSWMDNNPKAGISTCALINPDGTIQGSGGYFPTLARVFTWMTIQDLPFVDNIVKPYHPIHRRQSRVGEGFFNNTRELDWITGAFFLIRREVIETVGLIDEDYFMYVEEVDYCFRAKKIGWKVYYVSDWRITHIARGSGTNEFALISEFKNLKLFFDKHFPRWQLPFLRLFLKIGSFARVIVFGLLGNRELTKIYAKTFIIS